MSSDNWKKREEELRKVPPRPVNRAEWPEGVRTVGLDEMNAIGVDAQGMLYWHGKPVALRRIELRGWEFWFALLATIGAFFSDLAAMFPAAYSNPGAIRLRFIL